MSTTSGSAAMHAALRFVVVSDIPSDHKRVLIDVLTHAVREKDAADVRLKNADQTPQPWSPEDVTRLESLLERKVARSWQHADEILMGISAQLHRNPRDVRAKATELGVGHAVDYAIAKTRVGAKERVEGAILETALLTESGAQNKEPAEGQLAERPERLLARSLLAPLGPPERRF